MTPATQKKIQASRASNKDARKTQEIIINKKWKIARLDEYNWAIIRKGHEKYPWYYGRLLDALLAIPDKILDEGQMKTMEDILKSVHEVASTINTLRFTKFEGVKDGIGDS